MNESQKEILEDLVCNVISLHVSQWDRIIVNWELSPPENEDELESILVFSVAKRDGRWVKSQEVTTTERESQLVRNLRQSMQASDGDYWSTLDLEINATGAYEVKFDFEPPRRLSGVRDEVSVGRFRTYLKRHYST